MDNNVKMVKKIDAVTALGRDAVFVCFVVAIVASPASECRYFLSLRAIINYVCVCVLLTDFICLSVSQSVLEYLVVNV